MSSSDAFNARCDAARAKFAKYVSEPVPTDPYVVLRWKMAGAHLVFTEQLQNIYRQATSIHQNEEREFAYFAYIAVAMIEQHHLLEETIIFPKLEPGMKTDVVDEHASFAQPLHELGEYLKDVMGVEAGKLYGQVVPVLDKTHLDYDGAKVKAYMESFSVPLFAHLHHEVEWLAPENIRAAGVTIDTLKEIEEQELHHIKTELDPFTCLVYFSYHCPPYTYFPDMPWILMKVLIPWVFWWKNRSLWKYLPVWPADDMSKPKQD